MHIVGSVGFEFSLLKVLKMMSTEVLSRLQHLRVGIKRVGTYVVMRGHHLIQKKKSLDRHVQAHSVPQRGMSTHCLFAYPHQHCSVFL